MSFNSQDFSLTASGRIFLFTLIALLYFGQDCPAGPNDVGGGDNLAPLDGVRIEALETYQNSKLSNFAIGFGWWPLDPYYNGFSLDVGYTKKFGKTLGWEILHADYVYTVDKGLTTDLAQNYKVNPHTIERINLMFSSNLEYEFAYGKFVLSRGHIRYFRSSLLAGPALLLTNKQQAVGLGGGIKFEIFVNSDFSWRAELRDVLALSNIGNNLVFIFGTNYGF